MGQEPPSRQRRAALAGINMYLVVGVFAVILDEVFAVECVVLFKRFVRSKAVGIDGERLLLMIGQQESNRLRLPIGSRTVVQYLGRRR